MAHDPRREDYQRMSLQFVRTLDARDEESATRAFAAFSRDYASRRDELPQTDEDRAFHLAVLATEQIDYQLPFATDAQAPQIVAHAHVLLDEALEFDPDCFDAQRMSASAATPSMSARHEHLARHADEVRDRCEARRDEALAHGSDERSLLAADLAMRPYWRWLAAMAEQALICGRNHESIATCERLLASDRHDVSDVRFTYAYALAKLEDEKGLDELAARYREISPLRADDDAWMCIARLALAHKRMDFGGAREQIVRLRHAYPHAVSTLIRQMELPDGEFARLHVAPYSEDELILAVSEGIVLFQEGTDNTGRGVLGAWVAHEAAALDPAEAALVRREQERYGQADGREDLR